MLVTNVEVIEKFGRKHRDAAKWLAGWLDIAKQSTWASLADVRRTYPSADGVKTRSGAVVTVFNVKGNEYRLLTFIDYAAGNATVIGVTTHSESSKNPSWKDRL